MIWNVASVRDEMRFH